MAIERGRHEGPPAIDPLILPTRTVRSGKTLAIGETEVELIGVDIHSDDATVVWLPGQRLLLAADTVEDTITYVGELEAFADHLGEPDLRETDLGTLVAGPLEAGWINYFEGYEAVHAENVAAVLRHSYPGT